MHDIVALSSSQKKKLTVKVFTKGQIIQNTKVHLLRCGFLWFRCDFAVFISLPVQLLIVANWENSTEVLPLNQKFLIKAVYIAQKTAEVTNDWNFNSCVSCCGGQKMFPCLNYF